MPRLARKKAIVTLNLVAGWVDAVGFLALVGSVRAFPSFMSGNSTKVVTDVISGKFALAGLVAGVVLTFLVGTIVARVMNDGGRKRETAALAGVAGVLWLVVAGALFDWRDYRLLLLLAFGMGMINRSLQGSNGLTVHTFVSGMVVAIGSDIADALTGRGRWNQILLPLSIWAAILAGAMAGAALTLGYGLIPALIVPATVVSLLALINGAGWLEAAKPPRDGHIDAIEAHG